MASDAGSALTSVGAIAAGLDDGGYRSRQDGTDKAESFQMARSLDLSAGFVGSSRRVTVGDGW